MVSSVRARNDKKTMLLNLVAQPRKYGSLPLLTLCIASDCAGAVTLPLHKYAFNLSIHPDHAHPAQPFKCDQPHGILAFICSGVTCDAKSCTGVGETFAAVAAAPSTCEWTAGERCAEVPLLNYSNCISPGQYYLAISKPLDIPLLEVRPRGSDWMLI